MVLVLLVGESVNVSSDVLMLLSDVDPSAVISIAIPPDGAVRFTPAPVMFLQL